MPDQRLFFVPLTADDLQHIESFDCGDDEMNTFIRQECYDEQECNLNATYLMYQGGDLVAFCSICADRLILGHTERDEAELPRAVVPAIKIARLGRSVAFRNGGFGTMMLKAVHRKILDLASQIGARFMTLDAYLPRVPYYESLGFIKNSNQGKNIPTVSMRKDIYEPLEEL